SVQLSPSTTDSSLCAPGARRSVAIGASPPDAGRGGLATRPSSPLSPTGMLSKCAKFRRICGPPSQSPVWISEKARSHASLPTYSPIVLGSQDPSDVQDHTSPD